MRENKNNKCFNFLRKVKNRVAWMDSSLKGDCVNRMDNCDKGKHNIISYKCANKFPQISETVKVIIWSKPRDKHT